MSIVTLVSGGLDSTVMAHLVHSEGITQFPLFIDYGQLARDRELAGCRHALARMGLPAPKVVSVSGIGALLSSGLTDRSKHVVNDAFLPMRNSLFLTLAAGYAHQQSADTIGIGLLSEAYALFPDQTRAFLFDMETLVCRALGHSMRIVAPLMEFSKAEVVKLAKSQGVDGTYSCHVGGESPCGQCISCREYHGLEV